MGQFKLRLHVILIGLLAGTSFSQTLTLPVESEPVWDQPNNMRHYLNRVARELTQQIQDKISEEIRTHPEYWLWSYKHWRRTPGHTYPPNYPSY